MGELVRSVVHADEDLQSATQRVAKARIEIPMWYRSESDEHRREMRAEAVRAALSALDRPEPDCLPVGTIVARRKRLW